jgi:hypothetical protein
MFAHVWQPRQSGRMHDLLQRLARVADHSQANFVEGQNLLLYVDGTLAASAAGGTAVRDYATEIRVGEALPDRTSPKPGRPRLPAWVSPVRLHSIYEA